MQRVRRPRFLDLASGDDAFRFEPHQRSDAHLRANADSVAFLRCSDDRWLPAR